MHQNSANSLTDMGMEQARAQQIIENIHTAVMVFDRKLCLTSINTSGENLLSLSQRKIKGLKVREIFPGADTFASTMQSSLESQQPYMEWGMNLALANSREVLVDCRMTPLSQEEECEEIIVEMVDAYSLAKAMREESLSNLHEAASKSLQGMAHEIKNPLGGLRGAAQLLERELHDNEELREYTQIIISEADRLRNLIDRMVTPSSKHVVADINIHEVLEYVLNLVEAEVPEHLNLVRDYDPSLPGIRFDREQLIQVMLNILRNAVQAIREDGVITLRSRITRRTTIQQHYYRIAVKLEIIDDGPGVPVELEDGMFYPMVTGRADGTGLGLSIAQSLVQAHGGVIEYERDEDRTIFRILFPIQQCDE